VAVSTDLAHICTFSILYPPLCRCLSPSLALGCFWFSFAVTGSFFFLGFFRCRSVPSLLAVFVAVCFSPLLSCCVSPLQSTGENADFFLLMRSNQCFVFCMAQARFLPPPLFSTLHSTLSTHLTHAFPSVSYAILDITSVSHLIDFLFPVSGSAILPPGQQYSPFTFRLPVGSHPGHPPHLTAGETWHELSTPHTLQHTTQTSAARSPCCETKTKKQRNSTFFFSGTDGLSLSPSLSFSTNQKKNCS